MADTTRADVMSYLKANMVEISELISEIEEKFGVTALHLLLLAAGPVLVIHPQKKKMNSMLC